MSQNNQGGGREMVGEWKKAGESLPRPVLHTESRDHAQLWSNTFQETAGPALQGGQGGGCNSLENSLISEPSRRQRKHSAPVKSSGGCGSDEESGGGSDSNESDQGEGSESDEGSGLEAHRRQENDNYSPPEEEFAETDGSMSPFGYHSGSEAQESDTVLGEDDETGGGWLEAILEDLWDQTLAELEKHCTSTPGLPNLDIFMSPLKGQNCPVSYPTSVGIIRGPQGAN
ncbi:hypothetical protein FA13DRAFT_1713060 [Coprinellus micaceus]|uniref:Uncharacterized protein n=1 Tax=Coprinellus micaceus TaxID=71717 RepID=A0A4Y7SXX0_COPMI|nr:hypothetical protein FA13DRAFT_1713060 [Coprinellus micaceus]